VLALIATSCTHLAPIPGAGPLRYRDTIFSTVTKTTDVIYGAAVDAQGTTVSLKLDVYRPVGDTNVKRPLIIFAHGGSFRAGNKNSAEIVDEANTFAKKGYVTASIDYRLSTDGLNAIYRAVHDAQTSVRFFRAQASTYGVDPSRIAFGGSSAGAIMALLVGFNANLPGDVGSNPGFPSSVGAAVAISGAAIFNNQIGPGDAPSLLFHGTADSIVPYNLAQDTEKAAKAAGLITYLVSWQGAGHVPYAAHRDDILGFTTNFLYRVLDVEHAGT
jgi:acetyl esterase/lipase